MELEDEVLEALLLLLLAEREGQTVSRYRFVEAERLPDSARPGAPVKGSKGVMRASIPKAA